MRGDTRRLRLAALCQFTLPQPPIVYYGTEVGASQVRDVRSADGSGHPEESRLPMRWGDDQDLDLLATYQRLIAVRRAGGSLWRAERETLVVDDERGLLAVRLRDGERSAVVILNLGTATRSLTVPDRGALDRLVVATDETVTDDGTSVGLGPFSGAILAQGLDPGIGVG